MSSLHESVIYLSCMSMYMFSQDWLTTSARMIALSGHPVEWVTPLGMPVVQPYHKPISKSVSFMLIRITYVHIKHYIIINSIFHVCYLSSSYLQRFNISKNRTRLTLLVLPTQSNRRMQCHPTLSIPWTPPT